jgi:predicted phosphoadenosine phosphosulfate sulfurtransferase
MNGRKKVHTARNVKEAAIERTAYLFKSFDKVSVSFSGGKDSTACLHLALDEAKRRNRLPLRVIFFDEEVITPPTVEYVARVRDWPGVALEWYCIPVRHRNACSNVQPWWNCWDPKVRQLWVRDLPPWAITEHPRFVTDMTLPEFGLAVVDRNEVCIQGIRTQESMRRYRALTAKINDNFIARKHGKAFGYPIYDWMSTDVWRLVREGGFDYNRTYDIYNQTRLYNELLGQRVCAPFGEEPLRGAWKYAECFPDLHHKMLYRVPGAATAWRYGNTELYNSAKGKPDGMSWEEFCELQLANYPASTQREARSAVRFAIDQHGKKTPDPIPEEKAHLLSGCSWKFLATIAIKGDFKGRTGQSMADKAVSERNRRGVTYEKALEKHGTEKFKATVAAR